MDRFKMIASVYLILIRDNKVLLLRRCNTGYEDGKYGLPAGHVEDSESIITGMKREVFEETGVELKEDSIKLVHIMHRKEHDIRMDFFFTGEQLNEPMNKEPDKCDDLQWFQLDSLPENIIPYIKKAIENYRNNILYYEMGW